MDFVSFDFPLSKEQQQAKDKVVNQLLKNKYVKQWQQKHGVDDQFIYAHSTRFQAYVNDLEKCENCCGLAYCRQIIPGNYFTLQYDGMLQKVLVPCRYQIEEKAMYAHEKRYYIADMPRAYLKVNLGELNLADESLEYRNVLSEAMRILLSDKSRKGLYLWGKPGAGKSYLAAGMSNYYAKNGKKVAFVNVPKLIGDLKMLFHDNIAREDKMYHLYHVDVLVLDDIGGESITPWSRDEVLLPLLDQRMEAKKLTIFTSNYNLQELKEKLSESNGKNDEPMAAERILERIRTLSQEIFVKGNSRRK